MGLVATGLYTIVDYTDLRTRFAFIRASSAPATPTGVAPAGWSLDVVPAGSLDVWTSQASFDSSGNLIGAWSAPAQLGIQGARAWKYLGPFAGTVIATLEATISGMVAGDIYLYVDTATLVDGTGNSKLRQYSGSAWADVTNPTSDQISAASGDILKRATFLDGTQKAIGAVAFFSRILAQQIVMAPGGAITQADGVWGIAGDGTITMTSSRTIGLDMEDLDLGDYGGTASVTIDCGTHPGGSAFSVPEQMIDGGGWMGAAL